MNIRSKPRAPGARRSLWSALVGPGVALAAAVAAPAQEVAPRTSGAPTEPAAMLVQLADGRWLGAEPVAIDATAVTVRPAAVATAAGGGSDALRIPRDEVVGLHLRPARPSGPARVLLAGGDELRGRVGAGDSAGDTLALVSPVLGRLQVPLDRLARIEFVARTAGAAERDLALPADAEFAEALFRPARRGFDRTLGELHAVLEDAVRFQAARDETPRRVSFDELAAIALAGGYGREDEPDARLLSRAGDSLGVGLEGADERHVTVVLEGGQRAMLDWSDLASLAPRRAGLTFLADLPPDRREERSYFGGRAQPPLYPHRADRAATGGPLSAAGRSFVSGLGCHAYSALSWRAPDGASALVGAVAIDDSVAALGVRPQVDVRVEVDGAERFRATDLAPGVLRSLGRIAVRPGQRVALIVDFGEGLDIGDRVDWLGVAFVR
ncbi:MAG: NPCBM/NEW2 domain-containing protein [Planctomycetes bacterium]|nr:NPCBM/NEW2 domain-containing protein [Planctomycetota bacterium]